MNYKSTVRADHADGVVVDGLAGNARGSRRWLWIVLGVVGLVAAGLIAFAFTQQGDKPGAGAGDRKDQAPSISVITPGRTTIEGTITAPGTLAARRDVPVGVVGEGGQGGFGSGRCR